MAGVKVTDLTTLGTADATDILYIVDTTANQSKQIQVQNIYDGLPQFSSGTFTVVQSGENDCIVTPIQGVYSRVGNVVTCTINLDVAIQNTLYTCSFNIDPPVASNFGVAKDCAGIVSINADPLVRLESFGVLADFTNNKITISITSDTLDFNFQNVVANIQYVVI
jgi:hypothetical protein